MCFPEISEGLEVPSLERLITDEVWERVKVEAPVEESCEMQPRSTLAEIQGAAEPSWCSGAWSGAAVFEEPQVSFVPVPMVMMPVFVNVPMMVPVNVGEIGMDARCMFPEAQWYGWEWEQRQAVQEPRVEKGPVQSFEALPREAFKIRNTFVEVEEAAEDAPAKRRSRSCPRNFMRTVQERTTVCLRNLPNRALPARLEAHLEEIGFAFEAMHMPLDRKTSVNKGYAFIKFTDEDTALDFITCVEGTQLGGSRSSKRLTACFAARQGPAFLLNLPAKKLSSEK
jgi:hypothetical protein